MAVMCDINYAGIPVTGAKFTVLSAYVKQIATHGDQEYAELLSYQTEVQAPDGTVIPIAEWQNRKAQAVAFDSAPLAQAEADMIAVLTAMGATYITAV